jgi:hypothetical protein
MTNCANCRDSALYIYEPVEGHQIFFCGKHLPGFIRRAGIAKAAELVPDFSEQLAVVEKEIAKNSPKKSTKVTIDKSEVVSEEVELDSIPNETTEEEVTDERDPGLD